MQMPRRASGCSTDDTILGTERMGSPFNLLEMGAGKLLHYTNLDTFTFHWFTSFDETTLGISCTFNAKLCITIFTKALLTIDERAEDIELHPVGHSKSSFIRRLQTIEEQPDSSTVPTETRLEETDSILNEADLQSELSYASAYSSPMQSLHSYQLEETTV